MSEEPRKIEFDIEALVLAAACVFLWLSLLSYDPADSVGQIPASLGKFVAIDSNVYPPNEEIHNWCGWFGALASTLLVQSMGIGSMLVAFGLTVLTVWMFRVQSNYVRASRQVGWVLVIVAFTTFFSIARIDTPLSPVIGPGGYLGAITSTWLNEHFAILGAMILTLTVFLAGLLLSTDYVVVRAAGWMLQGGASVATSAAAATRTRVSIPTPGTLVRRPRRSDVDEALELDGDDPAESLPPIRIGGKGLPTTDADLPEVAGPSRNSFLGSAKSLAAGLLGSAPSSDVAALDPNVDAASPNQKQDDLAEVDEDFGDEFETEELPPRSESRVLEVDDETIQVRADLPHESTPEPAAPRVRPPKSKLKDKEAERQAMSESLAHLDDTKLPAGAEEYVLPGIDLLLEADDVDFEAQTIEVRRKAKVLESTFKDFGLNIRVVEIETGPVIAQYEIELEAGLRLSKVTSLADDLAIALRVPGVRIVAPIPGKNTVGIEVPNETRQVVRLREVIEEQGSKGKKAKIPLFLGKDVSGNALTADLATLPHLLIAGRTGTGKSVCLNAIIASILMTRRPDEVRMLMIDPKMVELSGYGRLPHLMHPVVTDMKKAEAILAWAVDKMEERYGLLARAGVRHISSYNELGREELLDRLRPESVEEADAVPDHLPFIVIVADEMADLMMTAGKEVEQHIIRLAQKSRAVGIHLILATQKPTVDVITGLIKSNLPARIAFQVASQTDSRVVLDEMGANKLLGNGDMLFLWPGTSMLLRGQGTYLSDEELNSIVDHCSTGEQNFVNELVNLKVKEEDSDEASPIALKKRDDIYEAAVDVVVREGRGSCSLLQRALGIGYGRAARLIDYMAEDGIVGQYAGSQAREVQISISEWESMRSGEATPEPPAQRSNIVRPSDPAPASRAISTSRGAPNPTAKPAAKAAVANPRQHVNEEENEQWEEDEEEQPLTADVADTDSQDTEAVRSSKNQSSPPHSTKGDEDEEVEYEGEEAEYEDYEDD